MIGESGVGKSECSTRLSCVFSGCCFFGVSRVTRIFRKIKTGALLARFVDGNFEPNFISTIGVDFKIHYMKLDGKDIKLQVWDTAGQERFRTITTSYYRGANGIMIVFDVTDAASFEKVRYWLNELKEHVGSDMPALLVGNKIDLTRERTVDVATAKRFSSEVNIRLRETSAKTNEGVTEAFADLVSTMLQRKIKEDSLKPGRPGDKQSGVSLAGQPAPAASGGGCPC